MTVRLMNFQIINAAWLKKDHVPSKKRGPKTPFGVIDNVKGDSVGNFH